MTPPGKQPGPSDKPDLPGQRGELLTALVRAVAPVAVELLDAVQRQTRDAGRADERDIEQRTRDLTVIFGSLLPEVVASLPDVERAVDGRGRDSWQDEEGREPLLLALVSALAPRVLGAVPGIVEQLTGVRQSPQPPGAVGPRNLTVPIGLTSQETGVRFGSPALGGLLAGLVQALPDVVAAGSDTTVQEIQLNWINFTGQRFPAGDVIALYETDLGDPDVIELELHQPYNTWWKGLEVFVEGTMIQALYVENGRRDAGPVRVAVNEVIGAGSIIFSKAAFLGIHTRFYVVGGLDQKRGRRLSFVWIDD